MLYDPKDAGRYEPSVGAVIIEEGGRLDARASKEARKASSASIGRRYFDNTGFEDICCLQKVKSRKYCRGN
jgi:hypothetical protein